MSVSQESLIWEARIYPRTGVALPRSFQLPDEGHGWTRKFCEVP